ncbi:Uncharacterised protein [Mycobacterium tuberculosis]|nr:Uncharacterised protein [Mycobacterium tuberculosis]CKS48614.1 Uncharacterised protein [Mycobacterium tuberculosis]CKV37332.1 Uncharacterised protein [Mycobacterium tuberculosis]CNU33319.1 Uncharacterised protein [Mycobacterium tuberculosis]CNV05633.1 Uncharacterised protein [Mycobacterium tuberculosis]
MRHVDAEAIHAAVQPEAQCFLEVVKDFRVVPVQVRLFGVEKVQVPLARVAVRFAHSGPGRPAEHRLPVVRRQRPVGAPPVAKEIAIPRRATREVSQRGLKPWVRRTGVVGHHVHGDFDALPVCRSDQPFERRHPAEEWVDVAGIGDVVSVVCHRRDGDRVDPDRVDTELLQVVKPARQPVQVAHPVAVAVGERSGIDLVEHGSRPPRLAHRIWLRSTSAGARRAGAHWIRSLVLVHQNGELTSE